MKWLKKFQEQSVRHNQAIKKAETAINNLRRMRYNGEADDDSWYYAEMKTLSDNLEELQKKRNTR